MEALMETISLGSSDIRISPIIMGTWQAGKAMWKDIEDKETLKAMRVALENGITTFDTAEAYGNGHSERIIGEALSDVRDQVVLADKVFANHLRYNQVINACHKSLRNLQTDVIDLYQIHWPPGSFGQRPVPLEEPLRAMNDLKAQGKVRAIGVSNFNLQQLTEACEYAAIDSLQPPYSLFWRTVEKDLLPYCRKQGITVLAYSPLAQGLLTGKFGPDHQFAKGDNRADNRLLQPEHYTRVQSALSQLQLLAEAKGITMGQLALAWVIAQPSTCAIAGARNALQAAQNAAAMQVQLTGDDLAALDRIGKTVTDHLDDNPVPWQ